MKDIHLIIGLGNPGVKYRNTRHNAGCSVVKAFAKKHGLSFKRAAHLEGEVAIGALDEREVLVFQPSTYMNESGVAVQKCVSYYKVPLDHLIVVSDDTALPLGAIRMRKRGSSGGHNGLKSIELHLHSQAYPRLRIGIGHGAIRHGAISGGGQEESRTDYVLGAFSKVESLVLEEVVGKAIHALELWLTAGIAAAMQEVNTFKGEESDGKTKETSL